MTPLAPLTPLEQSAATTGRRYFAAPVPVYDALCSQIDQARGYPQGTGTAAITDRGLPNAVDLPTDPSGRVLISVETWRITALDSVMLVGAITAGHITELLATEFRSLQPTGQL